MTTRKHALIIGSGPAGLMAADMLSLKGFNVTIAEAKPSPARKFLMAGKSGLNITKAEEPKPFLAAYAEAAGPMKPMIAAFGPTAVQKWVKSLGQKVFTGSSGRVFPKSMKASPLLRTWLSQLEERGVELKRRWRWIGWAETSKTCLFDTPEGQQSIKPDVTVLALGGASWARLGSDGAWTDLLEQRGVPLAPFKPANMGFKVAWSDHMASEFGKPVKAVSLTAGELHVKGEFVVSARGLEGSGIYAVSRAMRDGAELTLDLAPSLSEEAVAERLFKVRKGATISERLRKALKFSSVKRALLMEFAKPLPSDAAELASIIKALPIKHDGPRPMDEAISTAGGVAWAGVDDQLMLRATPGVFCAGEMLDWEAPTGGYLITGCLATGRWAGLAAANWAQN
ncbi:MAG: TIGR03862 family flavoprotein [Hyphomicrobiales bacterium]